MSAIRSDLPQLSQGALAPRTQGMAQAAEIRAAFFRAAVGQAAGLPPAIVETPVRPAAAPRMETAEDPGRAIRPGSLLDIRV